MDLRWLKVRKLLKVDEVKELSESRESEESEGLYSEEWRSSGWFC